MVEFWRSSNDDPGGGKWEIWAKTPATQTGIYYEASNNPTELSFFIAVRYNALDCGVPSWAAWL